MDSYEDKAKDDKPEVVKPAAKSPVKGPTFYRNPKGGPLTTTKPVDGDSE